MWVADSSETIGIIVGSEEYKTRMKNSSGTNGHGSKYREVTRYAPIVEYRVDSVLYKRTVIGGEKSPYTIGEEIKLLYSNRDHASANPDGDRSSIFSGLIVMSIFSAGFFITAFGIGCLGRLK
jgi:hypothetical protein